MKLVLVHGSYHGPWCWEFLTPELERRGHEVATVDLPIGDPVAGAAAYAQAVVEVIDGLDGGDPPVVVGHSMAGLVIPLVPAQREVRRLVYLAPLLPLPGMSAGEQRQQEQIDGPPPSTAEWTDLGDNVWAVGPNTARELFFHDATPELASWAASRLRPQCYRVMVETTPLVEWPSVPTSYITCRDDRVLNPEWSKRAARERLGVEPAEIEGAHSPFLTRPAELAELLTSLIRES